MFSFLFNNLKIDFKKFKILTEIYLDLPQINQVYTSLLTNANMNSTIKASAKRAYHTFTNAEFTGVCDINHKYHLFIKYGNKVYMDVKGVGDVVILFDELQKNKDWKYYYDLSLMLSYNTQKIVQELRYSSEYLDIQVYDDERYWVVDTPYIGNDMVTNDKILYKGYICYYKINPFDLERMEYTLPEDLDVFLMNYMSIADDNEFETMRRVSYNTLAIEHQTNIMEKMNKEIDELTAYFEDLENKKNIINLIAFYDNKYMSNDIFMIIYKNLLNTDGNKKYYSYISKVENIRSIKTNEKNMKKLISHIIAA